MVGGAGIPARYAGSGTGIVGMPGGNDTAGIPKLDSGEVGAVVAIDEGSTSSCCCCGSGADGADMPPKGPGCNVGGVAVPNRCAAVVAGPVASELDADATSLGGGALWN